MRNLGQAPGKWARYGLAPPWTASDSLFAMCALRPALCETLVCARGAQTEQGLGCAHRMRPTVANAASQSPYSVISSDQAGTGSPSVGIAFRPSSAMVFPPFNVHSDGHSDGHVSTREAGDLLRMRGATLLYVASAVS